MIDAINLLHAARAVYLSPQGLGEVGDIGIYMTVTKSGLVIRQTAP